MFKKLLKKVASGVKSVAKVAVSVAAVAGVPGAGMVNNLINKAPAPAPEAAAAAAPAPMAAAPAPVNPSPIYQYQAPAPDQGGQAKPQPIYKNPFVIGGAVLFLILIVLLFLRRK